MTIIEVKKLSKTYEYYKKQPGLKGSLRALFKREKLFTEAVKGISFSIERGELVGFLGPNGAGKTTTLKMLAGILYPSSGEARVLGFTPWERKREFQKQFALVMGQKNQLWWDLPAQESFILNKEIYEVPAEQYHKNLNELVTMLGVENLLDVQVRKLSLGERLKMELIAALLHSPKVLFLDEPTIGLDVVSQQKIREFIKKYNEQEKTTILLTSHYMEDVEKLCQRVIIIAKGELIYDGSLTELLNKYIGHKILKVTFNEKVDRADLEPYGKLVEFSEKRVVLETLKHKVKESATAILNKLPVDDILIGEVEIEEVIRKIFNEPR